MAKNIIKKAKNGTYYYRAHLGFDSSGKRVQKYRSGFKTKKEAQESYYELILQKSDFLVEESETVDFNHYINTIFLPWYKSQVKLQTYENRIPMIKKHFSYFNKFDISKIEPIDVQRWQLKLSESLSPSYVRAVQGLFSLAFDRAVVLGLAEQNPSKIIGNVKKVKSKIQFWTKTEFEQVLSIINKDDYFQLFHYVSIWLLFMTGLRIGEATALLWDDLNFDTGILSISKSLIYKKQDDYKFGETKTKASNRKIVLDKVTLNLLKTWKNSQFDFKSSQSFILSYNGCPTQKNTLSQAIKRYSKKAGIHSIRVHDLRHSHASLLIALGENPLVIRDRLGHEEIETTLGTYGHLYPNTNYEVASKLEGIISIHQNSSVTNLTRNQYTSSLT